MSSFGFDPSSLSYETQLEIGAKMFFATDPVKHFSPYIMALWLDAIMLGCLIVLYAQWRRNSAGSERTPIKLVVYYFMIISVAISCYILAYMMKLFVKGFGQFGGFLHMEWSRAFYTFASFCRLPAAAFYSYRAWHLVKRSPLIPVIAAPLILASLACSIAATSTVKGYPLSKQDHGLIQSILVTEVAIDLLNTLTIFVSLCRSRTGWSATDRLINRILIMIVETAMPPAAVDIGLLICVTAFPDSTAAALFMAGTKVQSICILTVIMSRTSMRNASSADSVASNSFQMSKQPVITIEQQTSIATLPADKMYAPRHSRPDERGQLRSVNGRVVPGETWMEKEDAHLSTSSLV